MAVFTFRVLLSTTCLTAALLCAVPCVAYANPEGGVVSAGQASISENGKKIDILQQSDKAVIDWRGFNIAPDEHTEFHQPGSGSITLNRVNSPFASHIDGQLTANGNVVIINQNGVMFGQTAKVDVNGLVATTANIDNDRFMQDGVLAFDKPGNPDAAIVNEGRITAKEAGLVGLVAPNVVNSGIITAKLGRVQLASGDTVVVDLYGDGLMKIAVSDGVKSQIIANTGIIAADGGNIALTAAAGKNIVNNLIAQSGALQARSVGVKNGKIIIAADKRGTQGSGSTVLVSGIVDASGRSEGERGGKITVTGDNIALLGGTLIDASGHTGKSGTTAGKEKSAIRDGSAGGEILIGGDYLGGGDTPAAENLYVDRGALILNDSLDSGDAGRTIFWSDGTTQFHGNVLARALGANGDGGFVETSGHGYLEADGFVDLTAKNGTRGAYFLDPANIAIYGNVDPAFQSTDGTSVDLGGSLLLWIDGADTNTVTLAYGTMSTTASGTIGNNTITVGTNAGLAVGARIRLGGAGATTTANTMGANTYTISGIAGTTITLAETLTTNYAASALYQGYVSQVDDKSGNGHNASQGTAASRPLWLSNGHNGMGIMRFDGANDFLPANAPIGATATFSLMTSLTSSPNGNMLFALHTGNPGPDTYFSGNWITWNTYDGVNNKFATFPANIMNGNLHHYLYNIAPGDTNLYYDGALLGTALYKNPTRTRIQIGGHSPSYTWRGNIDGAIVYNAALTANEQAVLDQYQSVKWDMALIPPGTGGSEAAKAMASDGYSVFTTDYLERLSQSADISLQATNNITLDLKGDTLAVANDRNFSLTTTSGNIAGVSNGVITTNRTGSGGNITMIAGGSGIIDVGLLTLNANGGGTVMLTSPGTMTLGTINATSILARATGAGSDITIPSGKVLTALGAGTPLTLVVGRNFINNAGAGALSAASGRWLVYSTNPASDTTGSLSNAFRRFTCAYGGSCPALGSGNGLLYSYTPTLTATPDALALIYGDAAPSLSGYGYTLSGYLGADSGDDSVTGSLNGSTTYAQGSGVGSYDINHSTGSLASAMGYGFSYANDPGAITVGAKALTITADDATRPQGQANPVFTASYNGFVLGDTSSVISGLNITSPANASSPTGSYDIIPAGASAANYALSYVNGVLTITPAASSTAIPDTVLRVSQGLGATSIESVIISDLGVENAGNPSEKSGMQLDGCAELVNGLQICLDL